MYKQGCLYEFYLVVFFFVLLTNLIMLYQHSVDHWFKNTYLQPIGRLLQNTVQLGKLTCVLWIAFFHLNRLRLRERAIHIDGTTLKQIQHTSVFSDHCECCSNIKETIPVKVNPKEISFFIWDTFQSMRDLKQIWRIWVVLMWWE